MPRLSATMIENFFSREVFEALRQMAAAGPVSFAALDARLSEAGRALLHEIASADEIGDETECLAQAEACLRRLEEDFRRRQRDDLRTRVKAAEREGRAEDALQCLIELHRLEHDVKRQ
jgi:hypothetical protein